MKNKNKLKKVHIEDMTLCTVSRNGWCFFCWMCLSESSMHSLLPCFSFDSESHSRLVGQWKWHDHPCNVSPTLTGSFICWFIVWPTLKRCANRMWERQHRTRTTVQVREKQRLVYFIVSDSAPAAATFVVVVVVIVDGALCRMQFLLFSSWEITLLMLTPSSKSFRERRKKTCNCMVPGASARISKIERKKSRLSILLPCEWRA